MNERSTSLSWSAFCVWGDLKLLSLKERCEWMSKKENTHKKCSKCQKKKHIEREYYMSTSNNHADGRIGVCKQCVNEDLEVEDTSEYDKKEYIKKVQDVLLDMNRPYIHDVWLSSVEEARRRELPAFGILLKNINLNHRKKNWGDSEFTSEKKEVKIEDSQDKSDDTVVFKEPKKKLDIELDTQNEKDVLRLLGYDPFEYEAENDRANLFNKLIDYLDESTLEDGFKLTSVIEIVRTFNQLDKINARISRILSEGTEDTKGVTALVNSKEKMLRATLNIAKENSISVRNSANSSKGAGTLSGIIKQLQEHDIDEAEFNLFDVNTAKGIKQVADLSNKSIMEQLQFDENDYSVMLLEQRTLLEENIERADKYEEESRKLRIELIERDKREKELNGKILELKNEIKLLS